MKKKIVGYLGPEGTYSHEVAMRVAKNGEDLLPLHPSKFASALAEGKVGQVVLPLVNVLGGQVHWVLDLLMNSNGGLQITQEILWQIRSHLIGFGSLGGIRTVYSHAQPLDQCQGFLAKMPDITTQAMGSTSVAVEFVANKKDPTLAAIGSDYAARMNRVPIIAKNISDCPDNRTLFVVLGGERTSPTGKDKTSILLGTANKPGALLRALEVLDANDINMTQLFSMPSGNGKWGEFVFFVDVDGHQEDEDLRVALRKIAKRVRHLKVLGSYPKSNRVANRARS